MGGRGYPPEIIAQTGAEVMLCGGLGRRAIAMFEELGIMVYVGASGTIKNAIQMYENGKLQAATDENACAGHGHGDGGECGHH
jgi:predicted Fe-Mo cluster-binding NifX family protein